ncbi:Cof-type HAD-IIB family hydrolase [Carnobacterium gallinarum]|uniref:Cof-type HAD-IIB family hydrolase n=1 Tax=Carnobacterium gallinarum TaxID=2749 RepID=UPI0005592BCD|nr:Cof-type HAD-IIB family hydrolase [Carnobacterium gallinarum]
MIPYKLIALDIDGTLNNDEKKITPKTREAIIHAQKAGAIVVLASGRPTAGFKREIDALELKKHHGLILSYNGGTVIDVETDETLYKKAIPLDLAKKFLKVAEDFDVTPIVDNGTHIYTNTPDGFQTRYESQNNLLEIHEVENIADALDFDPIKLLIASPEDVLKPQIAALTEPFTEDLAAVLSAPFYLEVTMPGISKRHSLTKICEKLNIKPSEVIAFGDAENDLSMLEFAGHAVAMGNACDALKEIADEITLTNNEDGIAVTLAKYFP